MRCRLTWWGYQWTDDNGITACRACCVWRSVRRVSPCYTSLASSNTCPPHRPLACAASATPACRVSSTQMMIVSFLFTWTTFRVHHTNFSRQSPIAASCSTARRLKCERQQVIPTEPARTWRSCQQHRTSTPRRLPPMKASVLMQLLCARSRPTIVHITSAFSR